MALTNEDLQAIAQLLDSKLVPINNCLDSMDSRLSAVEKQGKDTFRELMNVEKQVLANQEAIEELGTKYDTLLLKADNTALLYKLIDKQSEEMETLKAKVAQIEKKLA